MNPFQLGSPRTFKLVGLGLIAAGTLAIFQNFVVSHFHRAAGDGSWITSPAALALSVDPSAVAYDFNVYHIGGSSWLSLFHAEPNKPANCSGDSVAARYSPYGSPFSFGHHGIYQDLIISQTPHPHQLGYSPNCESHGGAANPRLIFNNSYGNGISSPGPTWGLYWLGVARDYLSGGTPVGDFRHYLLIALLDNNFMFSISNQTGKQVFTGGQRSPVTPGNSWQPRTTMHSPYYSGLADYDASPVYNESGGAMRSSLGYSNEQRTQGLLGSMTYIPGDGYSALNPGIKDASVAYYYYGDIVQNGSVFEYRMFRRRMTGHLVDFGPAEEVLANRVISSDPDRNNVPANSFKVNYDWNTGRMVLIYDCWVYVDGVATQDLCMQTDSDPLLRNITFRAFELNPTYRLKVYDDPTLKAAIGFSRPGPMKYGDFVFGQFGVLLDGYGRHLPHFQGDIVVYIPFGTSLPRGLNIYSKRIRVLP